MGLNGPQSKMPSNQESSDAALLRTIKELDFNNEYINDLNDFYDAAREYCEELEYCFDLTNIAPPSNNGVYFDIRHHNKAGNIIIADAIENIINPFL
jgi:hypothetical protein